MTFGTPPRLVAAGTFALAVAAAMTDVAAGQTPPPSVYLPPEATPPVAAVPAAAPLSPAAAPLAPPAAPLSPAAMPPSPAPGLAGPVAGSPLQLPPAPLSRGDAAAYPLAALDAASAAGHADEPAVRAWLEAWQARVEGGGATTAADAATLAEVLAGTKLPCLALDAIRRATQVAEPDLPAERLHPWVHATVVRAAAELAGVDEKDPQAAAAAGPVVRAAQEAPGLWDRADGVALEKQADVLVRFLPRGSEAWGWARVQQATALYVQGRYDDAARAVDGLARSSEAAFLSERHRAEVRWAQGIIRYGRSQWADAEPYLRIAAATPGYHHAQSASASLIIALAAKGDAVGASAQLAQHIDRFNLSQVEADRLLELVALECHRIKSSVRATHSS